MGSSRFSRLGEFRDWLQSEGYSNPSVNAARSNVRRTLDAAGYGYDDDWSRFDAAAVERVLGERGDSRRSIANKRSSWRLYRDYRRARCANVPPDWPSPSRRRSDALPYYVGYALTTLDFGAIGGWFILSDLTWEDVSYRNGGFSILPGQRERHQLQRADGVFLLAGWACSEGNWPRAQQALIPAKPDSDATAPQPIIRAAIRQGKRDPSALDVLTPSNAERLQPPEGRVRRLWLNCADGSWRTPPAELLSKVCGSRGSVPPPAPALTQPPGEASTGAVLKATPPARNRVTLSSASPPPGMEAPSPPLPPVGGPPRPPVPDTE